MRFGEVGTRPLTKTRPIASSKTASTALANGREENSTIDLEMGIYVFEAIRRAMIPDLIGLSLGVMPLVLRLIKGLGIWK